MNELSQSNLGLLVALVREAAQLVDVATFDGEVSQSTRGALVREQFTPIFSAFPEAIRGDVIERHLGADRLMAGAREGLNFLDVLEDLRAGGDRPDVPLILLHGTAIDPSQAQFRSEAQLQVQIDASRRLYRSVVDAAPEGEYREVPEASHSTIPMVAPDAVATAVKDVLERLI